MLTDRSLLSVPLLILFVLKHSFFLILGRHGAAVGTFFKFLRWSFLVNMLMGILFLGFVIVPYVIQHGVGTPTSLLEPDLSSSYNAEQEFLGLFTGGVSRKCPLTGWDTILTADDNRLLSLCFKKVSLTLPFHAFPPT